MTLVTTCHRLEKLRGEGRACPKSLKRGRPTRPQAQAATRQSSPKREKVPERPLAAASESLSAMAPGLQVCPPACEEEARTPVRRQRKKGPEVKLELPQCFAEERLTAFEIYI